MVRRIGGLVGGGRARGRLRSGSGTPRDGGAGAGGTLAGTGGVATGGAAGGAGGASDTGGAGGGAAGTGNPSIPVLTIGLWALSVGTTTALAPTFEINNHDSRTLPMPDMEIRYWFTSDLGGASGVTQSTRCLTTNQIACNTITLSLVAVSPARPMADTYLSVTFSPAVTAIPAGGYADFENLHQPERRRVLRPEQRLLVQRCELLYGYDQDHRLLQGRALLRNRALADVPRRPARRPHAREKKGGGVLRGGHGGIMARTGERWARADRAVLPHPWPESGPCDVDLSGRLPGRSC